MITVQYAQAARLLSCEGEAENCARLMEAFGPAHRVELSIRSFREGDEEAIAGLFNRYVRGFSGAASVTAESWREEVREQSWNAPSLDADRDCVRLAERDGKVVG